MLAALLLLSPVRAVQGQAQRVDDLSPYSDARLVSEVLTVAPGVPFTVALELSMDPGWHSYWENPGDAGEATSIAWTLPGGFRAGPFEWPVPERIEVPPLVSFGYHERVLLLTEVVPPDDLEPGSSARLAGKAEWLICAEVCLPAEADVELVLPVEAGAPRPDPAQEQAFRQARASLPQDAHGWSFTATRTDTALLLKATPPAGVSAPVEGAYFFSADPEVLAHAAPQPVRVARGAYVFALTPSEYAMEPAERLRGVLAAAPGAAWDKAGSAHAVPVEVPVEEGSAAAIPVGSMPGASMTLLWAVLLAFAGGLLLNLMPCVFPVLSIKVLSLAQAAGEDEGHLGRHGLVFGAGVVLSFWLLAGVLLALRAAGGEVGWGFQLQEPLFVAAMALLFFGIGLNLMGIFETGTGLMRWSGRMQSASGTGSYRSSFAGGALATLVASPCTAPAMGAALGFALTRSATGALAVFTALGVGMAAPYVLLTRAPRLLRRLPKPGPWMEVLRQVLAFPMFAATLWLVWVFGRQVGTDGMTLLLFGLLGVAAAAWIVGRWPALGISRRMRLATRVPVAGALALAVVAVLTGSRAAPEDDATAAAAGPWQAYSAGALEASLQERRPVFVDFTAAWCLTCQVNERTVLSRADVLQAFEERGIVLLKADWTRRDPEITRALAAHDRSGVPLYVLYSGTGSEPVLLPEVLTRGIVLEALRKLPAAPPVAGGVQEAPGLHAAAAGPRAP